MQTWLTYKLPMCPHCEEKMMASVAASGPPGANALGASTPVPASKKLIMMTMPTTHRYTLPGTSR